MIHVELRSSGRERVVLVVVLVLVLDAAEFEDDDEHEAFLNSDTSSKTTTEISRSGQVIAWRSRLQRGDGVMGYVAFVVPTSVGSGGRTRCGFRLTRRRHRFSVARVACFH
jgi:hypothetical protein